MKDVLIQSLGFILVIIIGGILKKYKLASKEDGYTLSTIIMNVTLPCALINNASGIIFDSTMIFILCLGLLCNIIMVTIGYLVSFKKEATTRASYMLCCAGYNIGNFILPFCQAFFPGMGVAYICMFDVGNAIMNLGGSFALASAVATKQSGVTIKDIFDKLKTSGPFITYMFIIFISVFKITIPSEVLSITTYIGGANGFLVMLMIGLLLEIKISKEETKDVVTMLVTRYGMAIVFACITYFVLPLPLIARQVLVITMFSPLTTVTPIFIRRCGYTKDAPAMTNSISIIVSIVIIIGLLLLFV